MMTYFKLPTWPDACKPSSGLATKVPRAVLFPLPITPLKIVHQFSYRFIAFTYFQKIVSFQNQELKLAQLTFCTSRRLLPQPQVLISIILKLVSPLEQYLKIDIRITMTVEVIYRTAI